MWAVTVGVWIKAEADWVNKWWRPWVTWLKAKKTSDLCGGWGGCNPSTGALWMTLCPLLLWWFNGSDWRTSCLSPSTSELRFTQQDGNKQQVTFSFDDFLRVCSTFGWKLGEWSRRWWVEQRTDVYWFGFLVVFVFPVIRVILLSEG